MPCDYGTSIYRFGHYEAADSISADHLSAVVDPDPSETRRRWHGCNGIYVLAFLGPSRCVFGKY